MRLSSVRRILLGTAMLGAVSLNAVVTAEAAGTMLIAREADSTTFDPIISQQNPDCWIFPNIFTGLVKASADAI